jgi:hypothetical protein
MITIPGKIKTAGQKLSNVAHNLSQDQCLPKHTRDLLKTLQKEWDAALMEIREKNNKSTSTKV